MLDQVVEQQRAIRERQIVDQVGIPQGQISDGDRQIFDLFQQWCARQGIKPFPASPAAVASYLGTIPDNDLVRVCDGLAAFHMAMGLASPIASTAVRVVLGRLPCTEFPRAFNELDRFVYALADPLLRAVLRRREDERDNAMRRVQNRMTWMNLYKLARQQTAASAAKEENNG